jgi:hypothetical protein
MESFGYKTKTYSAHADNSLETKLWNNESEYMEVDMPLNKIKLILVITVLGMAMMACSLLTPNQRPTDTATASTAVAQTLAAQMTEIANNVTNTPQSPTATPTEVLPTATPYPTYTPYPTPTKTPAPTATPVPCNRALFIADLTVHDGSLFPPDSQFSKDWRLKNTGSCDWTANYELVFYSGDKMDGASVTKLNQRVEPGETIDVSVDLTSPSNTGEYLGYWMLRSTNGNLFGLGANAKNPFWVDIKVIDPGNSYVYGFAEKLCDASWKEDNAPLPCQGVVGAEENAVRLSDTIAMENGITEDELGLWMSLGKHSQIIGTYPSLDIQTGDSFLARIGCYDGSENCHARFKLSYKISGSDTVTQLGSWVESYDGSTTLVDVDLNSLDGENVQFILTTTSLTNASTTEVFWFMPQVQRP